MANHKFSAEFCEAVQLSLSERKVACARAHLHYFFKDPPDNAADDAKALVEVFRQGLAASKDGFKLEDGVPLDQYLAGVIKALNQNRKDVSDSVGELIDGTSAKLSTINCENCGQTNGVPKKTICTGRGRGDIEIAILGGDCCSEFKTAFKFSLRVTERLYQAHAIDFDRAPPIRVKLSTMPSGQAMCGGETDFPVDDLPAQRKADVTLSIPSGRIDFSHLSSLPYIIHHEILVHAVQSLFTDGPRHKFEAHCHFTEGLLDSVACRHLCELLRDEDRLLPAYLRSKNLAFLDGAEDFQRHRATIELTDDHDNGVDDDAVRRRFAHFHGHRLHEHLWKLNDKFERQWGENWPYRLALSLNIADLDQGQRDGIWRLLKGFFDNETGDDTVAGGNPINVSKTQRSIKRYLHFNELEALIKYANEHKNITMLINNDKNVTKDNITKRFVTGYSANEKKIWTFDAE